MAIQRSEDIGNVIRNAIVFNARNWLGETMDTDSLLRSVKSLFELLENRQIDYVLVGGVALLYYVEGRNTEDLDLLMALSFLEKLPELKVTSQDIYFVEAKYGGLQIDILLTENPLFNKVHSSFTVTQQFLDRDIPLATVEGLLLLKLYALPSLYRQGNFARVGLYENDIATLIHDYQPNIPQLIAELGPYVSDNDLVEIKNILSEIQQRIERFRRGQG
jgi:hypothetical protein